MGKILHLENAVLFRKIIKNIVISKGFEVFATANSTEAMEILDKNEINLIITGNVLEDTTGLEFVEKISKSRFSSIPVILLTSTDSLEMREKLFSLGIIDYILKKDITQSRLSTYFDALVAEDSLLQQIRNTNIAVLDDSKFGLEVIKKIFELHAITKVGFFLEPEELLNKSSEYSIFFVDLVMPGISGEEVIVQLRKAKPNCVIIVVSSIQNYRTISNALMYGANDYISKPFDNGMFMARLKANARSYFLYKQLEKKAVTDGLTGLYNHRYICDYVARMIDKKRNEGKTFCVLLMDIDHFKLVNDTYGHQAGDSVLISIARLFIDTFSSEVVCGRYGGEEFLIVLDGMSLANGIIAAETVRKNVEKTSYTEMNLKISISGGILEHSSESAMEIIRKADDLLYKAKKNGRNRIVSA